MYTRVASAKLNYPSWKRGKASFPVSPSLHFALGQSHLQEQDDSPPREQANPWSISICLLHASPRLARSRVRLLSHS